MTTVKSGPPVTAPPRRRRAWVGFLLNILLPPGGYVYGGAPRIALAAVGIAIVSSAAVCIWTFYDPPGVYGVLWPSGAGRGAFTVAGWFLAVALGLHAAWLCRRPAAWPVSGWRMWLLALGGFFGLLGLLLIVRLFGPVAVYSVSSASMAPTLDTGGLIWTTGARAPCGGQRIKPGDVVAYHRDGRTYLARAIAGPGQTIVIRAARLTIDGSPVLGRRVGVRNASLEEGGVRERLEEETLANGARYTVLEYEDGAPQDDLAPTKVPQGFWFVLGDNRDNALDSRFKGPVAEAAICGVAKKILYSPQPGRIGARP